MRQHLHQGNVVDALVRLAVAEVGKTRARTTNLHIQACNGNRRADLVVGTAGSKYGKGVDERDLAGKRKACGNAGHVLLGDSHLEIPLGIHIPKQAGHSRIAQVGFEHHDIGVLFTQFDESLAVCFSQAVAGSHASTSRFMFSMHCHAILYSSSFMAAL
ncbi:hypothetical protein DSECCO2_561120 [anaerobic digester metagenome]